MTILQMFLMQYMYAAETYIDSCKTSNICCNS